MKVFKNKTVSRIGDIIALAFWAVIILLCLIYKDEITVERIVAFTPENTLVAVLAMLALFAVKSVSVFIYCGLLYAASGIIFPLPLAVAVNITGSVIMATIPFLIGQRTGTDLLLQLTEKHPKLKFLKDMPNQKRFLMSFFARIIGILPSDIIGLYFGATGIRYKSYITGALLGMLPQTVTFCLMGMRIDDVTSPEFLISFICELSLMIVSITAYVVWTKRMRINEHAKKPADAEQADRGRMML